MKLAVFNPVLYGFDLKEALKYLTKIGVSAIELGVGGYPGTTHADAKELIKSKDKVKELKNVFDGNGIEITALSVHGNALHPNKQIAASYEEDFRAALTLAGALNVDTVITFSGCPGDCDSAVYPNWVTCAWPPDYLQILEYQWDKLAAYWRGATKQATESGVMRIALEMHPGFAVYNPETLLKLRALAGDVIGANFDPSHLIWQGIDPVAAIKYLNSAIYHFHAKDTRVDRVNTAINGVLDTKPYTDELNRSWIFRTVGYGSDDKAWRDIFSTLSAVGYDGTVSIEHEDSLMTPLEGLEKAVAFLKTVMIKEAKPKTIHWA